MHDRVLTDTVISDGDEALYDANVKACAAHLADLVRVHGQPPEMIQPASYPRFQAHPGPARFPAVRDPRDDIRRAVASHLASIIPSVRASNFSSTRISR
jgi:hypothetical protein